MKAQSILIDFVLKEWLLLVSAISLFLTSVYLQIIPSYSLRELEVLFILLALFVAVNGLQRHGLMAVMVKRIVSDRHIAVKLLLSTFFLSMLVTNDAALIIMVPLTLSLTIKRKALLVIFEALAANAGSAFLPFGNPQNLYIYWFYDLQPWVFIGTIAPFSVFFLVLLMLLTTRIKNEPETHKRPQTKALSQSVWVYLVLLILVLLVVLRILPIAGAMLVLIYALLFDRKTLRIDYALLFSFFCFFGLAENLKMIVEAQIHNSEHIFLLSALSSQLMSNVPATLLFAKFTHNWEALLWGSNAGGFGSLFGSFANLIAYKLYIRHHSCKNAIRFTGQFLVWGYLAFFLAIGWYFVLFRLL